MKTTEFMDKQVMELSESQFEDHSFRFLEADTDDDEEEEAVDQFRLHRNRHYGAPLTSSSSLDQIGSTKTTNKSNNMSMVAEVDRIMKELSNKLLRAIEDLSGRLSQLESKMHYLENSMNDLKVSIEYDHGKTDGKLRQLENILREVQNGVQLLKDTQQIAEIQSQQAKVQAPSIPQTEGQNIKVPEPPSLQTTPIAPKQSQPTPLSTDTHLLHDLSNLSYQNQCPVAAPPTPSQGSPDWLSYNPQYPPSYNPPLSQTLGAYHQQIKPPVPPPALPHPNYQTAPELPQPLHSTHPSLLHYRIPDTGNVQTHFPPKNHPEERTYTPHSYNPTITESPFKYPGGQFAQHPYSDFTNQVKPTHHPSGSQYSEFSDSTNKPYGFGNYNDTSPFSTMKTSEFSSPWALDRENENTQYSHAHKILLPHALPTASFVASTEPSTGGTGNTAPNDEDVVEKVTRMGFRRDLVKATVKKLADNGQSVDLNEVLDKLMNN